MAQIGKAKQHVFDGREAADQRVILEDGRGLPPRLLSAFGVAEAADAGTEMLPLRRQEPVERAHERGLARARGPTTAVTAPSSKSSETSRKISRPPRKRTGFLPSRR